MLLFNNFINMHKISKLIIKNFKSLKDLELTFGDITSLVGNNNCGKSNILSALTWFLKPYSLKESDFYEKNSAITIEGEVSGLNEEILSQLDPAHKKKIEPYLRDEILRIKWTQNKPGDSVRLINLKIAENNGPDETIWKENPTGIPNAIKALFPEPIYIEAMDDANEDVTKNKSGTTISKLISLVIEPFIEKQESDFDTIVSELREKTEVGGNSRAEELKVIDEQISKLMETLFPGINLYLHIPVPILRDLFKSGTLKAKESSLDRFNDISDLGHGAQRMAQIALVRYIAENNQTKSATRRILLIDEPELYLHPSAIEQLKKSLAKLIDQNYQIVYSTHSPLLLDRKSIKNTLLIRKDLEGVTNSLKCINEAILDVFEDCEKQVDLVYELENASQIFFSDLVVFAEGITEKFIIPELWESRFGHSMNHDKTAFVSVNGSGNILNCMKVVDSMGLKSLGVVDLDFAFKCCRNFEEIDSELIAKSKKIFNRLASEHDFELGEDGYPKRSSNGIKKRPEEAFSIFASDSEGKQVVESYHNILKSKNIWLWKCGSIEKHLEMTQKTRSQINKIIKKLRNNEMVSDPEVQAFLNYVKSAN